MTAKGCEGEAGDRGTAPVLVVGCPRSGTTLLYHMLLSAGGFAVYRAETHAFDVLAPRFGHLKRLADRRRLMDLWLQTEYFRRSGLDAEKLRAQVLNEGKSGGDLLRLLMGSIARQQGVPRWAECTPEHILYLEEIQRSIPNALVLHVIRDGRDVAMSLSKQRWIRPLPWDSDHLLTAGLYWRWIVARGRELGRDFGRGVNQAKGPRYLEVRFEELNLHPRETLGQIGEFVGQTLDYDVILKAGIGSVSEPNTSFGEREQKFSPVGRWRELRQEQLSRLESTIGDRLRELGYAWATDGEVTIRAAARREIYDGWFSIKQWLKTHTPLGRRIDVGLLRSLG